MILREEGTELILIDSENILDEKEFVELNSNFIKVDSLPYSISGIYKYDVDGTTIIVDEQKDILALKGQRLQEIDDKFNDMMYGGTFESSLGFTADNRRGDGKDDKDNVNSLIELNQEPIYFKDHDNQFHSLTMSDLHILKQEMIEDGLGKYQWKWNKQSEIMQAGTIDDINLIIV